MQPPGDPDVVAGVKGLYAGLLEKVEFTILQLSNWNLLHPELIRNENQRVFDKLNDLAEAVEQQSANLSGCSSTVVDNISHPSRPNRPDLSQGVAAHDQRCRVNDGSVVYGGDDEQGPGGCRQVTLGSEDVETLAIRQGKGTMQEKGSSEAVEMDNTTRCAGNLILDQRNTGTQDSRSHPPLRLKLTREIARTTTYWEARKSPLGLPNAIFII